MNKCPVCKKTSDALKTAIKGGQYISERCERCVANFNTSALYARKFERESQKRTYAKDLIQRFDGDKINPEYVKAYPEEARKQWGDSVLRDNGVSKKLL